MGANQRQRSKVHQPATKSLARDEKWMAKATQPETPFEVSTEEIVVRRIEEQVLAAVRKRFWWLLLLASAVVSVFGLYGYTSIYLPFQEAQVSIRELKQDNRELMDSLRSSLKETKNLRTQLDLLGEDAVVQMYVSLLKHGVLSDRQKTAEILKDPALVKFSDRIVPALISQISTEEDAKVVRQCVAALQNFADLPPGMVEAPLLRLLERLRGGAYSGQKGISPSALRNEVLAALCHIKPTSDKVLGAFKWELGQPRIGSGLGNSIGRLGQAAEPLTPDIMRVIMSDAEGGFRNVEASLISALSSSCPRGEIVLPTLAAVLGHKESAPTHGMYRKKAAALSAATKYSSADKSLGELAVQFLEDYRKIETNTPPSIRVRAILDLSKVNPDRARRMRRELVEYLPSLKGDQRLEVELLLHDFDGMTTGGPTSR